MQLDHTSNHSEVYNQTAFLTQTFPSESWNQTVPVLIFCHRSLDKTLVTFEYFMHYLLHFLSLLVSDRRISELNGCHVCVWLMCWCSVCLSVPFSSLNLNRALSSSLFTEDTVWLHLEEDEPWERHVRPGLGLADSHHLVLSLWAALKGRFTSPPPKSVLKSYWSL